MALDPDAVDPLRRLGLDAEFLPDPVVPPSPSRSADDVRASLGVERGRRLLLLFGSLEERKGVLATLAALGRVPPNAARRLAVAIVGRTDDAIRVQLETLVAEGQRTETQVLYQDRFVPDAELDDLVLAADAVLAPYLGHVGSSGAVLRAAAAGTPVLATDAGMVGREVRRHGLGQTVDAADSTALARALARIAEEPEAAFDPDGAAAYARDHGLDRFVSTIHRALFDR